MQARARAAPPASAPPASTAPAAEAGVQGDGAPRPPTTHVNRGPRATCALLRLPPGLRRAQNLPAAGRTSGTAWAQGPQGHSCSPSRSLRSPRSRADPELRQPHAQSPHLPNANTGEGSRQPAWSPWGLRGCLTCLFSEPVNDDQQESDSARGLDSDPSDPQRSARNTAPPALWLGILALAPRPKPELAGNAPRTQAPAPLPSIRLRTSTATHPRGVT